MKKYDNRYTVYHKGKKQGGNFPLKVGVKE